MGLVSTLRWARAQMSANRVNLIFRGCYFLVRRSRRAIEQPGFSRPNTRLGERPYRTRGPVSHASDMSQLCANRQKMKSTQISAGLGSLEAAKTRPLEPSLHMSSSSVTRSSRRPYISKTCMQRPGPSAALQHGGASSTPNAATFIPRPNHFNLRAVVVNARVSHGHTVLITGIGGGVALLALQLCIALGAQVYVTSGSDAKLARAVDLGAAGGVNYRRSLSRFYVLAHLTYPVKLF